MNEKRNILIVDDERFNIKLLEDVLISDEYNICKALNAEEALKIINLVQIDLFLLDVVMPGIDGFELTRKLRELEETKLTPIILITSLTGKEEKIKGIEAGCDDFIPKPFDEHEVLARVKTLLKLSYYRRQLDEKKKFETVIHEISEGIIICDKNWKITNINIAAKNYLNVKDANTISIIDIFFKNYTVSISKEILLNFNQTHKQFNLIRNESEKFNSLYLSVNLDILLSPDNQPTSIVISLHDSTKEYQENIKKLDFMSFISHKFNTPISVIKCGLSLLLEEKPGILNENQKKILIRMSNRTESFITLVQKLILITSIKERSQELKKEKIKLSEYLSLDIFKSHIKHYENKINLEIVCPDNTVILNMNSMNFELVLTELIENAIKFNDKKEIEIKISAKIIENIIEISVSDNGVGIPVEEKDLIFEKFYQIDKYKTGNIEGVGLGLTIIKNFIEASNGRIQVESEINKGSTFTIFLPCTVV